MSIFWWNISRRRRMRRFILYKDQSAPTDKCSNSPSWIWSHWVTEHGRERYSYLPDLQIFTVRNISHFKRRDNPAYSHPLTGVRLSDRQFMNIDFLTVRSSIEEVGRGGDQYYFHISPISHPTLRPIFRLIQNVGAPCRASTITILSQSHKTERPHFNTRNFSPLQYLYSWQGRGNSFSSWH